jgi:hypothetical protein
VTLTGQAPAPTTIVFGTDGWRARIADEFTYDNVRRCLYEPLDKGAILKGQGGRRAKQPTFTFAQAG